MRRQALRSVDGPCLHLFSWHGALVLLVPLLSSPSILCRKPPLLDALAGTLLSGPSYPWPSSIALPNQGWWIGCLEAPRMFANLIYPCTLILGEVFFLPPSLSNTPSFFWTLFLSLSLSFLVKALRRVGRLRMWELCVIIQLTTTWKGLLSHSKHSCISS